jgi:hypothetical protein
MSHYSLRRHVSDQICLSSGLKMLLKRFTSTLLHKTNVLKHCFFTLFSTIEPFKLDLKVDKMIE